MQFINSSVLKKLKFKTNFKAKAIKRNCSSKSNFKHFYLVSEKNMYCNMKVNNSQIIFTGNQPTEIMTTHTEKLVNKNRCKKPCDNLESCPCIKQAENNIYKQRRMQRRIRIDNNILKDENEKLDNKNRKLEKAYEKIMADIQTGRYLLRRLRLFRKTEAADILRDSK